MELKIGLFLFVVKLKLLLLTQQNTFTIPILTIFFLQKRAFYASFSRVSNKMCNGYYVNLIEKQIEAQILN